MTRIKGVAARVGIWLLNLAHGQVREGLLESCVLLSNCKTMKINIVHDCFDNHWCCFDNLVKSKDQNRPIMKNLKLCQRIYKVIVCEKFCQKKSTAWWSLRILGYLVSFDLVWNGARMCWWLQFHIHFGMVMLIMTFLFLSVCYLNQQLLHHRKSTLQAGAQMLRSIEFIFTRKLYYKWLFAFKLYTKANVLYTKIMRN